MAVVVFFIGYCISKSDLCFANNTSELMLQEASNNYIEYDPNLGVDQWRLVPYIGWRKFAPVDAYYYDWLDFRRITRWRWWRW